MEATYCPPTAKMSEQERIDHHYKQFVLPAAKSGDKAWFAELMREEAVGWRENEE
jgi:hypothetical protein